jgi:quinol monooxygenase YgiN
MPRIAISGRLICADDIELAALRQHLPHHISLSRAEPGCLRFDITPTDDPLIWQVTELFADQAAFEAHKARTADSPWAAATRSIRRDMKVAPAED